MKQLENLIFRNRKYATRRIKVPTFGSCLIATIALQEALLTQDCDYVSEDARSVDEIILFYVTDAEMSMPNKKLSNSIYHSTR